MEKEMEERAKSLRSMLSVIELARKASKHCCESIIRLDMGLDCIERNGSWHCPACELRLAIKEHDQLHEEMFNSQHIESSDEGARSIMRSDRMNEQAMDEDK